MRFMRRPQFASGPAPISWYAGENNANDSMGAHNGTAGAGTSYAAGQIGQGFILTGTVNQAVTLPTINLGTVYSIDAWLYPTNTGAGFCHILSNYYASADFGAFYYRSAANVEYYQNAVAKVTSTAGSVPLNTWTRVTLTYDGSKSRIYINGVLNATETGTHSETFNNATKIGYSTTGSDSPFQGTLDEVKLYNVLILP